MLHDELVCDVVALLRFCFEEHERGELPQDVVAYTVYHFEEAVGESRHEAAPRDVHSAVCCDLGLISS